MLSASMPAAHAACDQKTRICGRGWLALNLPARPPNCLCLGLCHREAKVPSCSAIRLLHFATTARLQAFPLPALDSPTYSLQFTTPLRLSSTQTTAPPRVIPAYKRSLFCPVGCATTAQMRVCITDYNNCHFRHAPWNTVQRCFHQLCT